MKKVISAAIGLFVTTSSPSFAQSQQTDQMPSAQKEDLHTTFKSLIKSGALKCSDKGCTITDKDLLAELRAEGLIESGEFQMSSICMENGG